MLITKLNFLSSPSLWKRHFWENHKRGSNWAPSSQFFKDYYPIKKIRSKIQRILREMKNELSKQEYVRLYPGGSISLSFIKLPKYANSLKIAQLMIFYYVQLFETLVLSHMVWQSIWQSFYLDLVTLHNQEHQAICGADT